MDPVECVAWCKAGRVDPAEAIGAIEKPARAARKFNEEGPLVSIAATNALLERELISVLRPPLVQSGTIGRGFPSDRLIAGHPVGYHRSWPVEG